MLAARTRKRGRRMATRRHRVTPGSKSTGGASIFCNQDCEDRMRWIQTPFAWMCILNVTTGLFSAAAGLFKALTDKTPIPPKDRWTTANPWLYVVGGSLTILVGICNGFQLT